MFLLLCDLPFRVCSTFDLKCHLKKLSKCLPITILFLYFETGEDSKQEEEEKSSNGEEYIYDYEVSSC